MFFFLILRASMRSSFRNADGSVPFPPRPPHDIHVVSPIRTLHGPDNGAFKDILGDPYVPPLSLMKVVRRHIRHRGRWQ